MLNIWTILGTIIAIICFCGSVYQMAEEGQLCLFANERDKNITYFGYTVAALVGILFLFVCHKFYLLIFSVIVLSITAWFLIESYENNKDFCSTILVFFTRVFWSFGVVLAVGAILVIILLCAIGKSSNDGESNE